MRRVTGIVAAVLILSAGSLWSGKVHAQDSTAYTPAVETDSAGVKRCGVDYLATLGKDNSGHALVFKVSSATELMGGKTAVVFFAVMGLRLTHNDRGEKLKIADAALDTGNLKTRGSSMFRPKGASDGFIETSLSEDEMLTLPLAMLNGSTLSVKLAGEKNELVYALPRSDDASWNKVSDCFKRMHKQLEAAESAKPKP